MCIPLVLTCLCLGWAEPPAGAFDAVSSIETVVADAIERAEPSVVAIARVKAENNPTQETFAVRGKPRNLTAGSRIDQAFDPTHRYFTLDCGAGVVVGGGGEILTTFHVVRGAKMLVVRAAGRQQFEAEVIAADPRSDLAVIAPKPNQTTAAPELKPIAIGDASKLRKGGFLLALGNPFNSAWDGNPSASLGILANRARRIEPVVDVHDRAPRTRLYHFPTLLQLDSKLNLGMSGGAVINMKGELVGLTTTAENPSGFDAQAGYAIPIDRIGRRVIEVLKQGKEIEYGLLGIAPLKETNQVSEVRPNSPAAEGQVIAGDLIVGVNDVPIADFDGLILAVHELSPGDHVRLKILREGKPIDRTLVLAKFPVEGEVIATNRPAPWRGVRVDYMSIQNSGIPELGGFALTAKGVVVTTVDEGSPAAAAGLRKGQLIMKVDDKPVTTPRQFEAAVADRSGPVKLATERGPIIIESPK